MTNPTLRMTDLTTAFVPSRHGWMFPNAWENGAWDITLGGHSYTIGLRGRCGGMAFAALDFFRSGIEAADLHGREMPEGSSALARYLMRRQIESIGTGLGSNIGKFALMTYLPTGGPIGAAALTRKRELGNVLVSMSAGNPVPLGLIVAERFSGIGLNHQVVAWGAVRSEDGMRIRIYDPNFPTRDDVELRVEWAGEGRILEYVAGTPRKEWRALFVAHYTPRTPPTL